MNDFGRNDFTNTLRVLLEMPVAAPKPEPSEIGGFDPSSKAAEAGTKSSQQKTAKKIGTMLVDFEKKWTTVRENIRTAVAACEKAVKAHQANVGDEKVNNKVTSDAEAREKVMGSLDQKRADRIAQAPSASLMEPGQNATDGGRLKQASLGQHLAGIDPKTKLSTAADVKTGAAADFKASAGKGDASPLTVRAGLSKKNPPRKKRA